MLGREVTVLERGQTRTALALDLNPDFSLQVREADGREGPGLRGGPGETVKG